MKKSRCLLFKVCSAGLIFAVLFANTVVSALPKTVTVKDDFNDKKSLSAVNEDVWMLTGESIKTVELEKPGKVLKFNGKGVTAETTLLMTDWYYEIKSLSFDLKMPEKSGSNDIFFFDFIDVDRPRDYCGDYSTEHGEPTCYETWSKTALSSQAVLGGKWTDFGFPSDTVQNQWVSIKVEVVSDSSANIYVAPRGKSFSSKKTVNLSGKHTFLNSAVVFGDYQFIGYKLDNIVIKTESAVLKEDFEDDKNDLLEAVSIHQNTDDFSFDIDEEGGVRKLAFADSPVDDGIIAVEALNGENEHLKDGDTVLNTTYNMTFPTGCDGVISYVFGLESNDSSPCCENWAYVMNPQGGKIVYYDADGKETVKSKQSYRGNDVSVNLTLTKSGKLTVIANGNSITATGVKQYEGYTGFSVRSDVKKTIYLDNVNINNTYYNVLTTKSIKDDFSENRMGTVGHSDYAFNAEGGSFSVNDGELVFSGLSDTSYFGPAYPYETCELSFKLTSIYTTENSSESLNATYLGKWLGLDFGKAKSTVASYGTYCNFAVMVTHGEDVSRENWKEAGTFIYKDVNLSPLGPVEINRLKPIPASLFKDISYDGVSTQRMDVSADKAVCFKYVIGTDSVQLYLKRADESQYTLYAEINGVDTSGYFALCCTGYSFWTIDDFEVKNTAAIYNEAPPVEQEVIELPSLESRGIGVEDTGYDIEKQLNANRKSSFDITKILCFGIPAVVVLAGGITAFVIIKKKKAKSRKPSRKGADES